MTEAIKIRCSSLPLACTCPPSQAPDVLRVESADDEAAANGSAVHHLMKLFIGKEEMLSPAEAARKFKANAEEVSRLFYWATKCWESMADLFPSPQAEVEMRLLSGLGIELEGHADVVSVVGDEVRILDFKTGRVDRDSDDQLRGYAYLALLDHPEATRAYSAVIRVRDQTCDSHHYERAELEAWWTRTAGQLLAREAYRPGRHCSGCPRRLACPAVAALIERSVFILGSEKAPFESLAQVGRVYDAAKVLEGATKEALEAIRLQVAACGGKLPLGDGRQLELKNTNVTKIDAKLGLPVLQDILDRDQLAGCVTIGKTKMEEVIRAGAPKREKGKAVERCLDLLSDAGALSFEPRPRLECRRSMETIES